jgi:hypothetical protein
MRPTNGWHPEANRLKEFSLGRLSDTDSAVIEAHIADCASCCEVLAGLRDPDAFLAKLKVARRRQSALGSTPQGLPVIDGYEVLDVLGRGGMGVVYRARDDRLKRLVALKMILLGDFASEQHRARFMVEAETLGRLRHPDIVQVFEAGEQAGRPFLAMEFIEGGTLTQHLAVGGALPQREAAALVAKLTRAVHHAHLQGVIHRDLKPGNVMLSPSTSGPVPKITDFGLACRPGGGDVSLSGQVLGTPSYMSPEQTRGERQLIGPPTDIYSLGAVLYEVLTGRPPFQAATPLETVRCVLNDDPPPPSRLCPGLDADLSTICLKCLNKEPEGRYVSAAALADDLERWLAGEPISARPAGMAERAWKWARRRPAQAGLLVVSLLLVAAVIGIPTAAALRLHREQEITRRPRSNAGWHWSSPFRPPPRRASRSWSRPSRPRRSRSCRCSGSSSPTPIPGSGPQSR